MHNFAPIQSLLPCVLCNVNPSRESLIPAGRWGAGAWRRLKCSG